MEHGDTILLDRNNLFFSSGKVFEVQGGDQRIRDEIFELVSMFAFFMRICFINH